jgi:molybdenum cofactor guanylyltransferase
VKILGVVIAGGHSTRMGKEKAMIKLADETLLSRVLARMRPQVQAVALNALGDPRRFRYRGLTVFPDIYTRMRTPLAGIHAALMYAEQNGFEAVMTVPCDTPFIPKDIVEWLEYAGESTGAAYACSGERDHYATGLWHVRWAAPLDQIVRNKEMRRVQDFCHHVEAKRMVWAVKDFDPFFNINTPGDLRKAERMLRG